MRGSNSLEVVRSAKAYLLLGAIFTPVLAIYAAFISVEPYITPMFNSWGSLFLGILWLWFIFLPLYLFSFSIMNYTLWDVEEKYILKETSQSSTEKARDQDE